MEKPSSSHDSVVHTEPTEPKDETEEEYFKKHGVVKPPAPPPGYGTSQSGVQQLAAIPKTNSESPWK